MDTLSPQSILDHRGPEKPGHVVIDRLTRNTSPGRPLSQGSSDGEVEEIIDVRVPQSYRTSFSSVLKPAKVKVDRSRSVSPSASTTSSVKSSRSRSKSPGSKKGSARHVTYDSKVTVRHSDSYDNETETLSGAIDPSFDPSFTEFSSPNTAGKSEDYSSKIREMTQLIVKEYSDKKENEPIEKSSSQTSERVVGRRSRSTPPRNGIANGRVSLPPKHASPVNKLSREYDHDRTISYRQAITNHYSDEIKKLAEAKIEEYPARDRNGGQSSSVSYGSRMERSNSVPIQPESEQNNRLTPTKRTIGGSIGNFFRKLSPRLGRKSRKDKGSISSIDSQSQKESNESFSRNKVRNSFMKLMGRPRSRSDSKGRTDSRDRDLSSDIESGFVVSSERESSQQMPSSSNRILKSIEQNTLSDRDVYQKFKERQSPKSQDMLSSRPISSSSGDVTLAKQHAVKATQPVSHSSCDSSHTNEAHKENSRMDIPDLVRDIPRSGEKTLDSVDYSRDEFDSVRTRRMPDTKATKSEIPAIVVERQVPQSSRNLHTSVTSSLSRDESIGDCSLDVNMTGSEPSLSNRRTESLTSSKRVALGSQGDTADSESAHSPVAASTPATHLTESRIGQSYPNRVNHGPFYDSMPKLADSAEISIPECSKFPSYLKLSCAVSGYGRYSQYSSYKSIEKRSPYSSCSSLQSNPRSPEMPVTRVPSSSQRTHGSTSELSLISPQPLSYNHVTNGDISQNGGTNNSVSNGHSGLPEDSYPTGDSKVDGEYFLNITRQWENRLLSHCQVVEGDIHSNEIPEEVSGKIRAAVGKSNLLITKKFKQFQELCREHMYPSEDGKVPKWEDLQGFWDMIKLQADNVDDMFAEIELMRQNGWKELSIHSRASSVSSSPKSGSLSLSNASTPCGTPGSRRKTTKPKETPESSPERTEKMRQAAKARDDARKKLLAERRAAMKQKQKTQKNTEVEIFVADS